MYTTDKKSSDNILNKDLNKKSDKSLNENCNNIKMGNNRIEETFKNLAAKKHKAFIPFITCGFPDFKKSLKLFSEIDKCGSDIIEIGIPFSDPLADGKVIQETTQIALKQGINTDIVFEWVSEARKISDKPIAFMVYFNNIYSYGLQKFLNNCRNTGVDGIIIPDLPVDEFERYKDDFENSGICNIMLASLTSPHERLEEIARMGKGFIYCVSIKGVTGERNRLSGELKDFLRNLRLITNKPLAVGFGISGAGQVREIAGYCDGIIVGSKILSMILEEENFKNGIGRVNNFITEINSILKAPF